MALRRTSGRTRSRLPPPIEGEAAARSIIGSGRENRSQPTLSPISSAPRRPFQTTTRNSQRQTLGVSRSNKPKKVTLHDSAIKPPSTTVRSTTQQQPSIVNVDVEEEEYDDTMIVGARCAIYFEAHRDFFGEHENRTVGGWFMGTIQRTNRTRRTATIRYDDNSTDTNVPFGDIRTIRHGIVPDHDTHIGYWKTCQGGPAEIFCDQSPVSLSVGDLVMGNFQNGHGSAELETWYRGRVAALGESSLGYKICDIAYDDDDYEKDIPYGKQFSNVTLLERGFDNPQWMDGLRVHIPSKKKKSAAFQSGIIQPTKARQSVYIKYTDDKGNETTEKRSYDSVAKVLFEIEKSKGKRFVYWHYPDIRVLDASAAYYTQTNQTSQQVPARKRARPPCQKSGHDEDDGKITSPKKTKTRAHPSVAKLKTKANEVEQRTRPLRKPRAASSKKNLELNGGGSTENVPVKRKPRGSRLRNVQVDVDVVAVADPPETLEPSPAFAATTRPLLRMDITLCRAFGNALKSKEALEGADKLQFMLDMHGRIPQEILWKSLISLNTFGPICGSQTQFPDTTKMNLVSDYLLTLFSHHGMLDLCSTYLDHSFKDDNSRRLYVDTFFEQMQDSLYNSYYMTDGDESRESLHARERICDTLHAKACYAEVFSKLLLHQVRPCIVAARSDDATQHDSYETKPIVCDIVKAKRGCKAAFEGSVVVGIQLWLKFGPLLFSNDGVDSDLAASTRDNVLRLGESMGLIISLTAWIYGQDTSETVSDLSYAIGNTIRSEIQKHGASPENNDELSSGLFLNKAKLRFVGSLRKDIVPQLRPRLAEQLDVASLYNLIHG